MPQTRGLITPERFVLPQIAMIPALSLAKGSRVCGCAVPDNQ